jgi:hypothetical protein
MAVDLPPLSSTLRQISTNSKFPLKLGHTHQLVAAVFGYKSLAAYQAAVTNGAEHQDLDRVKHVALNQPMLATRADDLNVGHSAASLVPMLQSALEQCIPAVRVHMSEDKFEDVLRDYIDNVAMNDNDTASEMASTNGDGIDEIYMPFDLSMMEAPESGSVWELEIQGHVGMNIDTERPYSGHQIDIQAQLTLERMGLATFGEYHCKVIQAKLDYGWGDDDHDDSPKMSLAEALAAEMGLTVKEAEDLVDADPVPTEGHGGTPTGYEFDFTHFAPPKTAKKILKRYQSLRVHVSLWFFEQVAMTS